MIRFLIFLHLYSIIYIYLQQSNFLLIFFLHISPEKSGVITTTHFKICPIFCEICTYFHGISVNFMVKYVKDAF